MGKQEFAVSEKPKKPLKYPKSIFFIVSNEFCERFNYYGLRTVLSLYLTSKLNFEETQATVMFHIFTSLVYFFPLLGAILADSWLGKFRTILFLSILYVAGSLIITAGSIPPLNLPGGVMTIAGLLCIAIGSGGIKPCVSAFGGDQFKLPEQLKQLAAFFSVFYFAINAGSLISTFLTPILRADMPCFGDMDCFPLAFGVPAALMSISIVIFAFGRFLFVIKDPGGNMFLSVCKCIGNAFSTMMKDRYTNPKPKFLDYAEAEHGKQLVQDIRALADLTILYLPLPIFWALFDQQGSRWTFQATRLDGEFSSFTIKPDHLQVVNPFLILSFIPLFEYCLYPLLEKIHLNTALRKLTIGGILASVAFLLSGLLQMQLEHGLPQSLTGNQASVRLINGLPCTYIVETDLKLLNGTKMGGLETKIFESIELEGPNQTISLSLRTEIYDEKCPTTSGDVTLSVLKTTAVVFTAKKTGVGLFSYNADITQPSTGKIKANIISYIPRKVHFTGKMNKAKKNVNVKKGEQGFKLSRDDYDITVDGEVIGEVDAKLGGIYTFLITEDEKHKPNLTIFTTTPSNSVNILWQVPQYVVMTAAEVMFSVTGLSFSYSQAPESMKSVLQALWLITVAVGNVIVVGVAETRLFVLQSNEFFLFAALMFGDMLIFMLLGYRYKYKDITKNV